MRLPPLALAPYAAALTLALASTLAGCGQKGPLVMPDTDTSSVVIRPSATPAPPGTPAGNTSAPSPAPAAPTSPPARAPASSAPTSTATPTATPTPAPQPTDDDTTAPRRDSAPLH